MTFYDNTVNGTLKELFASAEGLTDKQAETRRERYGFNELEKGKGPTVFEIFFSQFANFLVVILIVAAVISFAIGEPIDTIVILFIVIMNAVIGTVQEYRAEKTLEALKKMSALQAKVLRHTKLTIIDARLLVPGDIIHLESGDKVPADCRIIEAANLKIDEATLTGESSAVRKHSEKLKSAIPLAERENMAYMSTVVTYGRATAVVTAIGMKSEIGRVAKMIQEVKREQTPLQKNLDIFAGKLGIIILVVTFLVLLLEIFRTPQVLESLAIAATTLLSGDIVNGVLQLQSKELFELFLFAIALAVAAIPEGLPAVITITYALGLQRMAKRNALIRKLPAVETLGSATVICSDKTGTLTKNEMTVREIFVNGASIAVTGSGYNPEGKFKSADKKKPGKELDLALTIGVHCNDAVLQESNEGWKIIGDPTEGALVVAAVKKEITADVKRIDEIPFDSARKMMTTIHKDGTKLFAYTKGAPEILLENCSSIMKNGKKFRLSEKEKQTILKENERMASNALRILGVAFRELSKGYEKDSVEEDLTFVGLIGMIDPPREEVKDALALCTTAGIQVKMITGDNALTAKAIAEELGLIVDGKVLTGPELDEVDDISLRAMVAEISVFARVSPEHKLRIVSALKANGEIVAMTGDGVNDAPAVKMADIGISMGIIGTDVTREASAMILRDDNFATIVSAIEEGRKIYANIKHFIKYLLAANTAEVMSVTVAALIGLPLPFLPVQILWINLVTDGLPALALGVDTADPGVMGHKPRPKNESIMKGIWHPLFLTGIIGTVITLVALWLGMQTSLEKGRTMAFTCLIMFELLFVFNCRSKNHSVFRGGLMDNSFLVKSILSSFVLLLAVIYIPFLQPFLGTVPLDFIDWVVIMIMASLALSPAIGNFWAKK